ncbi:MAG: neuromedin U [Thermodesulfobacteriota bacterium]|nr:neuromedin U [Thermodesulfobacteriota bacterium]
MQHNILIILTLILSFTCLMTDTSQAGEAEDLAALAQNPVANAISLPLQNNTMFNIGPDQDTANLLNIQPVIPLDLTENWNLITRTIVPVLYVEDLSDGQTTTGIGDGNTWGLGDINFTGYISPAKPGKVIWGVGPSLSVPSATDDLLGSRKWSGGLGAVALAMPKPWTLGVLVRQLWSFAGDSDRSSVSQFLAQPFINYNMSDGWYLVSAPVITSNWKANSDDRWVVPLGGGVGKLFSIGSQALNLQISAYYNVVKPDLGPEWSTRLQLQFLFPTN